MLVVKTRRLRSIYLHIKFAVNFIDTLLLLTVSGVFL